MTRSRVRGNGEGCAYKRGKTWEAQVCFYDRGVNTDVITGIKP